jgi:hypothetical protein
MAGETINKPNGPGREHQHRRDGDTLFATSGLIRVESGQRANLSDLLYIG